jgi:hypothetical protein
MRIDAAILDPQLLGDEDAADERGSDMPLAGTAIIAPGKWVERIAVPVLNGRCRMHGGTSPGAPKGNTAKIDS